MVFDSYGWSVSISTWKWPLKPREQEKKFLMNPIRDDGPTPCYCLCYLWLDEEVMLNEDI